MLRMSQVFAVPMHVVRVSTDVGDDENGVPDGHDFRSLVVAGDCLKEICY